MYIKIVLIAVACLLTAAYGLQCNVCTGSSKSDCANNVTTSMMIQTCRIGNRGEKHRGGRGGTTMTPTSQVGTTPAVSNETTSDSTTTNDKADGRSKKESVCVYLTLTEDGEGGVSRFCSARSSNVDICKHFKKHLSNVDICTTCQTDKCN